MMGAIKTKLNKVSSTAFQKVTGKLKRQQLHDCRGLQPQTITGTGAGTAATTTKTKIPQAHGEGEEPQQLEKDVVAAATTVMMLHQPPSAPPPAGSADPRIPPDYKLHQSLVTAECVSSDHHPSPRQPTHSLQSAAAVVASTSASASESASASSWASYESKSSSSPESAMSVEYTLTPAAPAQNKGNGNGNSSVGTGAGGTSTAPIDLTASTHFYGNSPANPIDLTGSLSSPTMSLTTTNAASVGHPGPSLHPASWDYMMIDDYDVPSYLEDKICDEDDLMDHHFRQMEADQMRSDEAMARELQARLDQDARAAKKNPSFLSPHPHSGSSFVGGAVGSSFIDDHDQDEALIRAYGQAVLEIRCPKCRVPLVDDPKDIIVQTISHVESGTVRSHLTCLSCNTSVCLSCYASTSRATPSTYGILLSPSMNEEADVLTCCAAARVSMVWLLSCGHQAPPSRPKPSRTRTLRSSIRGRIAGSSTENKKPDPPKSVMSAITSATSSSSKSAYNKGVGYGGEDVYPAHVHSRAAMANIPQIPPMKVVLSPEDQILAAYFRALAAVLPSLERSSAFDLQPDSLTTRFLRRSPLLPKAAELLRNDSIDDILAKEDLYRAVLAFVQALAGHIVTARLVHSGLVLHATEGQTLAISVSANPGTGKGKTKAAEKTNSLASIVSRLGNICRRITQRASAHMEEFAIDDGPRMLRLCGSVVDLDNFLTANRCESDPVEAATASSRATRLAAAQSSAAETAEKRAREHREWHQRNCLADVLDEELWKNYYFAAAAGQLVSSQKGRMKRLITETTNLASSLPEGVYVRHASSRLDTMKVMIVGPVGTPYENGLFEFDLFCPENYPYAPPSMQFRTTGGGLVRFNPNLYEDGKGTCLDILP